jgi:RNA polymerase sigma factor (sigma-70 family)
MAFSSRPGPLENELAAWTAGTVCLFFVNPAAGTFQDGNPAFVTTHWSIVLTAQGGSPAAQDALEKLCRSYWLPLYAFIRREGYPVEEAKDLTQDFFARWLERRDFDAVRREKGRLRSYLLVSLKHFLTNEHNRATAIKRGRGQQALSLDEISAEHRFDLEPIENLTAEQIYERRWALAVLDQVLAQLENDYRSDGRGQLFDRLKLLLTDEPGHASQAEIAAELQMTENAVKQAFHRLRVRYREVLREQIAHTVATAEEVEDELRHLIAVLRT